MTSFDPTTPVQRPVLDQRRSSGKLSIQRLYYNAEGPLLILQLEKLDEVTRLVRLLKADFQEKNLLPPRKQLIPPKNGLLIELSTERNATLERLKLYTRDAEDADPLFNEEVQPFNARLPN